MRFIFCLFFTSFLLVSTKLHGQFIIAHRGGSFESVENTLEAFSHAISAKADIIEFDVQMSKDLIPIVVHNPTTKRFFKGEEKAFCEMDLSTIKALEGKNDAAICVPTLTEALAITAGKIGLIIELKSDGHQDFPKFVEKVLESLSEYKNLSEKPCFLGSFSPIILEEIKKQAPKQPICFIVDNPSYFTYLDELLPDVISVHHSLLTKELFKKVKKYNLTLWTWTVNQKKQVKKCFDLGIDGVITDWPNKMKKSLKNRERT